MILWFKYACGGQGAPRIAALSTGGTPCRPVVFGKWYRGWLYFLMSLLDILLDGNRPGRNGGRLE